MRNVLLFSLLLTGSASLLGQGQPAAARPPSPATPAQAKPETPVTPAPVAQTPPVRRAPAATAARAGMAITVTDPGGTTLSGITVSILGATDRSGESNASGQANFPGLQAGTYRLRFSGESVIAFEKEVTLRAGQVLAVDVTLNPAPKPAPLPAAAPAPAPPPAAAPAPAIGPVGEVRTVTVVDLIEKEFVGKQPRRESLLSCSANLRTTTIQINDPLPERLYANADAAYYVIAGEGTSKIDGRESRLSTSGFVSVPRGVSHSFARRGSRPLILLMVLGGEPCDAAK